MELPEEFISVFKEIKNVKKTNNYYYERHECPVAKENIKVTLDLIIAKPDPIKNAVEATRFGVCPHCGTMFYTYENERFLRIKR